MLGVLVRQVDFKPNSFKFLPSHPSSVDQTYSCVCVCACSFLLAGEFLR